jgi:hypothetical protein
MVLVASLLNVALGLVQGAAQVSVNPVVSAIAAIGSLKAANTTRVLMATPAALLRGETVLTVGGADMEVGGVVDVPLAALLGSELLSPQPAAKALNSTSNAFGSV